MSCGDPVPFETLVALWARELAPEEAERVEDHVFGCETCAATSARLDRLVGALGELVPPVLSRAMRDRLGERGFAIRDFAFSPGEHGSAYFAPELDLLVFALRGELADVDRVDLEVSDTAGHTYGTFAHVPFDAARGEVLVACQQHFRELQTDATPVFRLFAHSAGTRREVGRYEIEHVWPSL